MRIRFSLLFTLAAATVAEARPWMSTDGRTLEAEFVSRDATSVTVLTPAGKQLTIQLSKLHPDETDWLNAKYPTVAKATAPDPNAVFDTLLIGDDRGTVTKKLKESKFVSTTTDEAFFGRSGLNGIFSTVAPIGKVKASLYFDWSEDDTLKEVTLQTDYLPASEYDTELKPTWEAFIELLSALYGKPVQKGPMPAMSSLSDGMFFPSHLWTLKNGKSALLGTACSGKTYQLVVRFTRKTIQPVEVP